MRRRGNAFILLAALAASLFICLCAFAQVEILASHPLNPALFTQGLEVVDDRLILSSGLYGRSMIGQLDLSTGQLRQAQGLPREVFAEGLTETPAGIWLLSWQEGQARLYDRQTLTEIRQARYSGEGWGLCFDGERLYMSDGSATLTIRDPDSFEHPGSLPVSWQGQPIPRLNELEYANGYIYANVWMSDEIIKIDRASGEVLQRIDLSELRALALPEDRPRDDNAVLNGIAHIEGDRFYVTGKRWHMIFELRLP